MTQKTKVAKLLNEVGYYLLSGLQISLAVISGFFIATALLFILVYGMFGPMYWSPWLGLISIPATLAITFATFVAIADWRNW